MSIVKLSVQDRKDLEKFTKFLVLKAVQVIVQSRLGEKIRTKSKPHSSGSDWFNLAIRDVGDIQCETKRALTGQMLSSGTSVCTEISLKTVEGDTLVLETWRMGMSDQYDPRITYTVYNRMSLLLKSLIAVARVTPAYKLSCRQGPDSYVICYRVYTGEPQYYLLGEGYQEAAIGDVGTPIGTISLSVVYRTKLTITPQRSEKECPITSMLKSDHFRPDVTPCQPLAVPTNLTVQQDVHTNGEVQRKPTIPIAAQPQDRESINGFMELPDHKRLGAFATTLEEETCQLLFPESPLLGLLRSADDPKKEQEKITARLPANDPACLHSGESEDSACDDFVMVELKPPFAESDGKGDLGAFFRDCQSAPPLVSFNQQPTLEEQVGEISCQLAALETSVQDFDEFVNSLCYSEAVK